jgi:hypothetical protein
MDKENAAQGPHGVRSGDRELNEATQIVDAGEPGGSASHLSPPAADQIPTLSPAPQSRGGGLGCAWAIFGIVGGFVLYIVPGIFALRSYTKWRSGQSDSPRFAWACGWVFVVAVLVTVPWFFVQYQ